MDGYKSAPVCVPILLFGVARRRIVPCPGQCRMLELFIVKFSKDLDKYRHTMEKAHNTALKDIERKRKEMAKLTNYQ